MSKKIIGKGILIFIGIVAVSAFLLLDLQRYFNIAYIKNIQSSINELYQAKPVFVLSSFFLFYLAVTTFSLPGAAILTIASGAFFGLFIGTILASFASTIGATLSCIVSRYLIREWVQKKFHKKLKTINAGIVKEGSFYLFSMRLIPIFPFFFINLAMGVSHIKIRTFFWVSQLGMLPGTIVFVNAGQEISKIDSLESIMTPQLLISFILLGALPLVSKTIIGLFKKS